MNDLQTVDRTVTPWVIVVGASSLIVPVTWVKQHALGTSSEPMP